MSKFSLQAAEFEISFQSFVQAIRHWKLNPDLGLSDLDLDALREYNIQKSNRKLSLDISTSQSTICRHLKR